MVDPICDLAAAKERRLCLLHAAGGLRGAAIFCGILSRAGSSVGEHPRTADDGTAALSGDDLGGFFTYGVFAAGFGQGKPFASVKRKARAPSPLRPIPHFRASLIF